MSNAQASIQQCIQDMNAAWLEGRLDGLGQYFADNAVIAPPGGQNRVVGRDAVVDSFRQYNEQATTHAFEQRDLQIDTMGSTAVARLYFRVRYEYDGSIHEENGQDILVLTRSGGEWRIVWRTQLAEAE